MTIGESESVDQMVSRLRAEGRLDEESIRYLITSLSPEGQKCVLPGETREEAIARLRAAHGWSERTARLSLAIAEGESDIVPDRPLTEAERREIDLVAGDEEDDEANEEIDAVHAIER